ncbi:alpha-amylase family glycosyl hydrolase [Deinococcus maricopensis]|uniref:Alpha-amylase n=1 Tax=Deinococcus maricopensis (strain DSM 21211 / LMG 22137 / NRRL B-23946 / LB-34) TaxID=709986 RepID=E8U8W2_DEIML|nr:alpha-amylase family glycosyl hydrolase [Deinococcus maricopensis]ADV67501.1 Cyclomaltodextrin glucanotransferase [Deinococcus maricopensis DSM 21211]
MKHLLLLGLLTAPSALAASADAWRGQVIYQVLPDRFADGDAGNNAGVNRDDLRAWHGGDLTGLTARVPYLHDLGVTAVWLTPVYAQQPGRSFDTDGYHGYWPADFRNTDAHFGTLADFDTFIKTAHSSGLKVMLDQVVNHTGYTAPLVRERPAWFHNEANCAALGNKDVYCPLSGLPDLAQERADVRDFLYGNADFWRARGVDGFRYDAIKHVPEDFLKNLVHRDADAGTFTLGEYYGGDAGTLAAYQRQGLSSLFDFPLQAALKSAVMTGSSVGAVRTVLEQDQQYPDANLLATFLDNHDVPRFANGSLFEDEARARTVYGVRALMTLRGIPVLYQGTEIAMRGGGDPDNRRDMRFPDAWTPEERAVYEATKGAIATRQASRALSVGSTTLVSVPEAHADDLLLFERTANSERVMVAWNNARDRRTYSVKFSGDARALTRDLFGQDAKLSVSGGYLHVSLPGRSASAFTLK